MGASGAGGEERVGGADLARILSPLLLFVAHAVYLALWSPDPFFNKWIDGSFSFFLALVLCNIVRARVLARSGRPDGGAGPRDGGADPGGREGR